MPSSKPNRPPSQADVARVAGVSSQTVSRVVSGQANVHPDTAARVLAAIEELDYRVNHAASSLASGRTRIIGLIVVSTKRYSSAALSVGVESAAASKGYSVTTAAVADHASLETFLQAFDRLEQQGAEGIVLGVPVPLDNPQMRTRMERIPTIRSERAGFSPDAPLAVDQGAVSRLAVEHLLGLGHETVWHVTGDDEWQESGQRREAWAQTLEDRGVTPPPEIPGDWTPESGYRAGRTIAAIPAVTAVFVSSDEMAFGLLRALHEAGKQVPSDIAVVSVDDIALAAYASPALTTVRQPFEAMGKAAALRLIAEIEGESDIALPPTEPTLIVRDST